MSYEELLENARDRWREFYSSLAPDGVPRGDVGDDAEELAANGAKSKPAAKQAVKSTAATKAAAPKKSRVEG